MGVDTSASDKSEEGVDGYSAGNTQMVPGGIWIIKAEWAKGRY